MREALPDFREGNPAWTRRAIAEAAAGFDWLSNTPNCGAERDQTVERRARWPIANSPAICERAKRAQPAQPPGSCSREPRTDKCLSAEGLRIASGVAGDPSPPGWRSRTRPW